MDNDEQYPPVKSSSVASQSSKGPRDRSKEVVDNRAGGNSTSG